MISTGSDAIKTRPSKFPNSNQTLAFDVDGMLGGLAKWLRILGYDASYPISRPSFGRIFVTARKRVSFFPSVQVTHARPEAQLLRVLNELEITPDPALFLSRCLVCNVKVKSIPKEEVYGKVPPQIFKTCSEFNQCPVCSRIYWEGSHGERIIERLKQAGIEIR